MERNDSKGQGKSIKLVLALVAAGSLLACNYGGDHKTPHPPVNPAMSGSPSESDHTNADAADLSGGYGTGTNMGAKQNDNTERTQASTAPAQVPDTASVAK